MTNVSKIHTKELFSKALSVKDYLMKSSAPEHIVDYLDDVSYELNLNKFGLNFEKHREKIEDLPTGKDAKLIEQNKLSISNGNPINWLIEGENYLALKQIKLTHTGHIDVICIDPPYNTGMKSLNYNDHSYIDLDDTYFHSKWISFMDKRIKLAHNLLSYNGVMFINIDENEIANLLLLCGKIFGENNIDVLIWPKTDYRFDQNRIEKPFHNIKMVHEYILVCFKDKAITKFNKILEPKFQGDGWVDSPKDMETILKGLGTTSSAKDELAEIFGSRHHFQTPKPMRLIKELVRASSKKDSVVLDFFAGSGTTGHSVMDLNKEDNGRRSFILVTNNENEICREITYKRLKTVINKEKYKGSLIYYYLNI